MPAINLVRLQQQLDSLVEIYDRPGAFVRRLHEILDFYADRTHRSGQAGEPAPLIGSYNVPAPLTNQLNRRLGVQVKRDEAAALHLIDTLWSDANLEMRSLAVYLLGQLDPVPEQRILSRAQAWVSSETADYPITLMVESGFASLYGDSPGVLINAAEDWLESPHPRLQVLALRALAGLAGAASGESIPSIFKILTPVVYRQADELREDLIPLLRALARISPSETAYFLREALTSTRAAAVARLTRACLPDFPADLQAALKEAERAAARSAVPAGLGRSNGWPG